MNRPDLEQEAPELEQLLDTLESFATTASDTTKAAGAQELPALRDKLKELAKLYATSVVPRHEQQLKEIRGRDLALQPKLNKLLESDVTLQSRLDTIIDELADSASTASGTPGKDTVTRVTQLISDVRDQERLLRHLFYESTHRDRGFSS